MLSEQSKINLGCALHRSIRASLVREAADECRIESTAANDPAGSPGSALIMITLSSFGFRLLTIFQLSADSATRGYYLRGASDRSLEESFYEVANMCCGGLKRDLSAHQPHLAMSAPDQLQSPCLSFLDDLQPQYRATSRVTINESVQLQITQCLCCSTPIDIPSAAAPTDDVGGALELF